MRESACQTFSSENFPASSVLLSHPLTEPHDLVISYKFNTLKRSLLRELRTRFKMHLSRGVLIALALGASNVAARPQFSFNLAFNIGPEEQPSRHSNPEPTTSAARVKESSSSGAGNLFRGWLGGSNDHTTSQPDGQKTSLRSNAPRAHARSSNAAGPSVVSDGFKSGSASYTTVAGPISVVGHSSSKPPPSKKGNDSCWSPFKQSKWEPAVRWRWKPVPSWSIFSHDH
jgi:hypothetical protein